MVLVVVHPNSSEPSAQSSIRSHFRILGIHIPLLHVNWSGRQVREIVVREVVVFVIVVIVVVFVDFDVVVSVVVLNVVVVNVVLVVVIPVVVLVRDVVLQSSSSDPSWQSRNPLQKYNSATHSALFLHNRKFAGHEGGVVEHPTSSLPSPQSSTPLQ